ncbi:aldo/keto reductase [Parenemella sanctibonifatiensis]|uniref:2,5-diketo-D-gluconic acid reductase n=1 Tax=Parenemella sanctibonifatiensis TaxID=2016505 RepID=A0A255EBC7_9ACTN|nr:aldo/keto reductase [Parenemella sanctibonifatiensis]OYN88879.1 2,5-diketo-D-gluconic acid reductase [Parenemella sanctibonifatiensis]
MSVPTIRLNDGTEIPQLGFGVFKVPPAEAAQVTADALAAGYRHIDTAAMYHNEEGVGQAIAASGINRDDLWITTKLDNVDQHRPAEAIRTSLRKLGLDHVDLYLIHWPMPQQDLYLDAWLEMEKAQQEGLIRSIGVSNFHGEHLRKVVAGSSTVPSVDQVEIHPSLAQYDLVTEIESFGTKAQSWSPLGRSEDLEAVEPIAAELGRTAAQVIIRWHLQRNLIVIPKTVNPQRMAENFDVFSFELDGDTMAALDALDAGNRVGSHPDDKNA